MKNILLFTISLLSLTSIPALSDDGNSIRESFKTIDSYAKAAGMCSTYAQMSTFEEERYKNSRDSFTGNFLINEAKRLNLPQGVTMVDYCLKISRDYTMLSSKYNSN
ncbi:hypothetical protein L2090_21060 [Rahnella victoriana]|nr:hypothetical protein [Rahnella victoriana]